MLIPRENSSSNKRLNTSAVFKARNKRFGTWADVRSIYVNEDFVLKQIFIARYAKTTHGCPNCGKPYMGFKQIKGKRAFRCKCNFKVFPLKGTHLEECRTPLLEVLGLIFDLFSHKNGVPATYEERITGRTPETCLNNLHRIADWMGWCNNLQSFTPGSILEVDEVYPIVETGLGPYFKFKRGAGSERTMGVLVLVENDSPETGLNGICKSFVFDKTDKNAVRNIIRANVPIENNHTINSDDSNYYNALRNDGYRYHNIVKHSKKQFKDEETGCHTNTVEGFNSLVKTQVHRVHKGVKPGFLQFYLDRITFNQSNRSKTIFEVIETLLKSLPDLDNNVNRRFKIKKRKKKVSNKIHFNQAA